MYRVSSLKSTPVRSDTPSAKAAIRRARLVMLFDPGIWTNASIGRSRRAMRIESDNELAVLEEQIAVDGKFAAIAQIANHVPMNGRFVLAACFGIASADRHMDGAADLLVEKDIAGEAVDIEVSANSELTEDSGSFIGLKDRIEVILATGGCGFGHLTGPKGEFDALNFAAGGDHRITEGDMTIDTIFDRTSEDFAVREVVCTVSVDPGAAGDVDGQIGPRPGQMNGLAPFQPFDNARPFGGLRFPGGDGIVGIEFAGLKDEVPVLVGRLTSILGKGIGWVQREGPAHYAAGRAVHERLEKIGASGLEH